MCQDVLKFGNSTLKLLTPSTCTTKLQQNHLFANLTTNLRQHPSFTLAPHRQGERRRSWSARASSARRRRRRRRPVLCFNGFVSVEPQFVSEPVRARKWIVTLRVSTLTNRCQSCCCCCWFFGNPSKKTSESSSLSLYVNQPHHTLSSR